MPSDLLIRGGTVVLPGVFPMTADIAVEDGAITAIGPELPGEAREEIDARGLHVLPGVIDAHVHFNEPGRTDWEGWATGSRALAAGGATACVEMPLNAHPPTVDGAAFDAKVAAARASALVDFALWGGLVAGRPRPARRAGRARRRRLQGLHVRQRDRRLPGRRRRRARRRHGARRRARPACRGPRRAAVGADASRPGTTWRDFVASRPVAAELEAIERALALALETGCTLHVVHVSSGDGVALVAAGRARGVDVTCETCPHYLTLTEDDLDELGARAKCAPPLRTAGDRDALWAQLAAGRIAFVASDHSPCPPEMKAGDFTAAWGGIAGCQSLLALLLDAQRLPLQTLAALTSANVASRLRLPKGRLEPGADADLVLVDLGDRHAPELHDRHRLSPFAGRALRGRIVRTLVRGTTVFLTAGSSPTRRSGACSPRRRETPNERPAHHRRPVRVPRALGGRGAADVRRIRRDAAVPATRSSTSAGAASRPGSRSATSRPTCRSRTTRATPRPARSCSIRAASARPRSCSPTEAPASRASSGNSPATTS